MNLPDPHACLMSALDAVAGVSKYELHLAQHLKGLRADLDHAATLPHKSAEWWKAFHEIKAIRRRIGAYVAKHGLHDRVPRWAQNSLEAIRERTAKGEP